MYFFCLFGNNSYVLYNNLFFKICLYANHCYVHFFPKFINIFEIIFILVVVDSDLIKPFEVNEDMATLFFEECVSYLIKTLHKKIDEHKNMLPVKARKFKYPTEHQSFTDNTKRKVFGKVLKRAVLQFNEMRFTKLRSWDCNDKSLVVPTTTGYRFTSKGLACYWRAIDKRVILWNHGTGGGNNRYRVNHNQQDK